MSWLHKIFGLCDHKWVEYKMISVYAKNESPQNNDLPIAKVFILQCEKCGDLRKKDFN